ncbi:B-box type zinc finger protein ncl-1-like [Branchiostoma lanceolatum]|uniref:B-box type zinc finger protein ncl-1-like n=1 Tax=Branchiostoma lanceolatum TaxID=7740 RepID=UPI003455AE94
MELQCGLCDHQYSQPRVLSCLHTYCLSCLETLVKKQDREGEVCCPVCQQRTLLPSSDPSTLPSDPIVGMLLEVKSVEAGAVTCTSCEENSSAVCRCLDCAAFLCSNCQGAHRFMKCFKSHRLVELEKLSIGDLASPVKLLTCTKHDGEALEFYCNTCDMLVCLKCTAIDHRMTSHQYVYINDAAAVMKERLLYLLENGRKRSEDVRVQLLQMEEKIDHVQVEGTRVKGEVDKVFHTLLTKLEDRQEEMRQDVETLYQRQQQFLNTQGKSLQYDEERLQAGTRFVEKLVTYGSISDLLTCGKLVTSQFDLLFKQCTDNDMKSSGEVGVSVDYHTFSNLLNRIQIKIKTVPKIGVSSPVTNVACSLGAAAESSNARVTTPLLKEEFSPSSSKSNVSEERTFGKGNDTASMDVTELHKVGSFGKRVEKSGDSPHIGCIAVGANGNIYVLNTYSWLVQVFDKEGKYRFKFGGRGQSPGQLQWPVELATSTKGYIAVRESTTDRIQIFSDTGQFIFKFWLHSVHKPRSMVIDRRGRFLVEDVGKGRFPHGVVIYNSDGKLLTKIRCTEISKLSVNRYSLAISAQNQLLVVDHRANCVQVYSEEGRHLRTIHPRCSRLDIRGIIMDQNKLILILNNRVDRDSWYIGGLVVMAKDGTVLDKFKFPEKVVTHVALTHEGCPLAVLLGSSDIHVYGSIHTK